MNYLWGSMILIGIIYGTVTGHLEEVSEAAIQSSKEAVSLCVVMAGVTALWVGMMRIAEKSGLLEAMEQRMQPVLNFLFPEIPGNHPSRKSIATNLLANVLGLGWAATPAGLKAMEELADLEEERRRKKQRAVAVGAASNEYIFPAINPGQYHCFSDRIWQCDANGDRWSGNPCDGDQYGCCRFVYQNKKLDGQTGKS